MAANTFATTASQGVYKEEWAAKLLERLNKPQTWKDCADVVYSDTRILHFPYLSTGPTAQSHTRDTGYSFSTLVAADSALSITTSYAAAERIDRGDLAQLSFSAQMELADRQGVVLDEQIETAFLATQSSLTNVGDPGTGITSGNATQITVSAANIDEIIRGVRRIIITANGASLAQRNGIFFVWRPQDYEYLEQFAQANGFSLADRALKNGIPNAFEYMGVYHYVSNSHTANHVVAGVRKVIKIGLLRSTYGQIVVSQDPGAGSGTVDQYSAVGVTSRVDYGTLVPTGLSTLVYDVNVV